MPEISRFYGIVIKMFFKPKEREPSHIHAIYGEYIGVLLPFTATSPHIANACTLTKARKLAKCS